MLKNDIWIGLPCAPANQYIGISVCSIHLVTEVPEVIRNHENGYLCRGYLAEDISEKILELEEDRKKGAVEEILKCAYTDMIDIP